jgi:hypothetical protein
MLNKGRHEGKPDKNGGCKLLTAGICVKPKKIKKQQEMPVRASSTDRSILAAFESWAEAS